MTLIQTALKLRENPLEPFKMIQFDKSSQNEKPNSIKKRLNGSRKNINSENISKRGSPLKTSNKACSPKELLSLSKKRILEKKEKSNKQRKLNEQKENSIGTPGEFFFY